MVFPSAGPVAGPAVVPNASPGIAWTVPANITGKITAATFCNTSGGALTLSLWINGSDDAHAIVKTKTLASLETWVAFPLINQNIQAAGTLQWQASGAGITGTVSAVESTN